MSRDGQPYISPNSLWPPPKLPFPFWVSPQLDRRENRPFLFKHLCGAILQPFYFHIHACNGGVYPPSSTFGRSNPQIEAQLQLWSGDPDPVGTFRRVSDLSPFSSNSCALFCTFLHVTKTQLFSFQAIPHSLPRTTRGGGVPSHDKKTK